MDVKVGMKNLEFGWVSSWNADKGSGLIYVKMGRGIVVFDLTKKQSLVIKGEDLEWTDPVPSTIICKKVLVIEREKKSEGNDVAVRWTTFEECCLPVKQRLVKILKERNLSFKKEKKKNVF
jgi:hypothetical protein